MKLLKIYWKKLLSLVLICILGLYVCLFGFEHALKNEIFTKPKVETCIYTVWHVETFEGGGKSRINYLKNCAKNIEKKNSGILFYFKQIKPEKLEAELQEQVPDIISFGFGVGKILLPYLAAQDNAYSVRDSLIRSGMFNNKLYAIAYIASGYAMISHSNENLETIYGFNRYTNASILNENAIKASSQYDAYKQFVNNKKIKLIGTARDVFRVENLNKTGRINASISPLDNYTDLIQYIATTKQDKTIGEFVASLLSFENQMQLIDYYLFSSLHTKIYTSGIYNDMENSIISATTPNVFYE